MDPRLNEAEALEYARRIMALSPASRFTVEALIHRLYDLETSATTPAGATEAVPQGDGQ